MKKKMEFFCCLPLQGGNLRIGQASKPKKAHGKMAAGDPESDSDIIKCVALFYNP